jgi:putative peptide zinc metalloprotease protein
MTDTLFSPSWYRVAELKPRLRSHAQIHRHDYRGQVWHVLQDHAGGRSHRFTPAAWRFIGLMDGERTVNELWENLLEQAGDEAPTQDEVIRLLGQLHAADALIIHGVTPDSQELFRRFQRHERMRWKQKIWTPLAVRIPVFDPERFLERTFPYVRFVFSRIGALVWLTVVTAGVILAGMHWGELTENIADQALTPQNLVLLWFVYPVVKALHELGHGYAAKKAGGEVHEIGIMLLVLVPVPYVDVSSAWGFRDKYKRMLVGAAGIGVELFLGALALFVWLNVETGAVHAIAYNVMLISGVSTLLFNGNPLLRFDGYYVLADALEIPNLGSRSNKYLGYLIQRYLFKVRDAESSANSQWERVWFVLYGIAAFIYRMFIMFVIILYIGGKFFAIGVLLAIWAIITQLAIPLGKNMRFLFTSPKLRRKRKRSVGLAALVLIAFAGLLFVAPAPFWTRAEGIIWPSEQSQVRAGADGFIVEMRVPAGQPVRAGDALIETRDPLLAARVAVLEAHQKGLKSQLVAAQVSDRVQTAVIREELAGVKAELERAQEQSDELLIRSPRDGVFVVQQEQDLPDRFVRKGQLLAYVVDPADLMTVRVVVSQDEIGLLRERTRKVDVMPVGWGSASYPGEVLREVPGGTNQLPTAALGSAGGGPIAVDPRDANGQTTMERVFEVEIGLPQAADAEYLGSRMFVRFDHGYRPVGLQLYRSLRQLFLRRFSV